MNIVDLLGVILGTTIGLGAYLFLGAEARRFEAEDQINLVNERIRKAQGLLPSPTSFTEPSVGYFVVRNDDKRVGPLFRFNWRHIAFFWLLADILLVIATLAMLMGSAR